MSNIDLKSSALRSGCARAALVLLLSSSGLAGPLAAQPTTESPSLVKLEAGTLRGAVRDGVASYKGVPFAAPPIGALRWRPPAPVPAWTGVRDSTSFGAACFQFEEPPIVPAGVAQSEDCLNLNIWAPASRPRTPLPVMVWIHGGGLEQGTGSVPFYSGEPLAKRGVIVVTINYRLGRLGFFAHPGLSAESPRAPLGNYGVMDQIAALRWVKANIAAFGGDPSRVTIFGESSGAEAVLYLLAAPSAHGLFQRAIAQSGWPRWRVPVFERARTGGGEAAEAQGEAFARANGISGKDEKAVASLRSLSVATLQRDYPHGADFFIDGVLIPRPLFEAFAAGQVANVPLMIGGNSWEANLMDSYGTSPDSVFERTGDSARARALFDPTGKRGAVRAAYDLFTDIEASEPNRRLADLHTTHGARAFLYRFDYVPAARRASQPGAAHAAEIGFVFGTLPKQPFKTLMMGEIAAAKPEDWAMSDKIMAYWTAFARTGDPGAAAGPRWPAYLRKKDPMLEFNAKAVIVRERYNAERLDWLQSIAESAAPSK